MTTFPKPALAETWSDVQDNVEHVRVDHGPVDETDPSPPPSAGEPHTVADATRDRFEAAEAEGGPEAEVEAQSTINPDTQAHAPDPATHERVNYTPV